MGNATKSHPITDTLPARRPGRLADIVAGVIAGIPAGLA